MFDLVRNNKRIVQIFLALIALPFAFFGVESYMNQGSIGNDVARVGEAKITRYALDEALREEEQTQRRANPNFDSKTLRSAEGRRAVLENLINRQLLWNEIERLKILVPDEAVRQVIAAQETFQDNGKFSNERYNLFLAGQGLNPLRFESDLRRDLALRQIIYAFTRSNIVNAQSAHLLFRLQTDKRQMAMKTFKTADFLKEVTLKENESKAYFESNPKAWIKPARAQIEYVVFSPEIVAQKIEIQNEEIKERYQANLAQFEVPEARRASHILIAFDKNKEESKKEARLKIEKIQEELKRDLQKFVQIASKESQDWGSRKEGGDLGFFAFDAMDENFSKATFLLEKNQLSPVVETEYGFHLILLTDIRPKRSKSLEEAQNEIMETLRNEKALRFFNEHAEEFVNITYDQFDSLEPVAQKLNLKVEKTDWVEKEKGDEHHPLLNEEILKRVFSPEAIEEKRNTEALDLGNHTLISARVKVFEPSSVPPFEEVAKKVEESLKNEKALLLAKNKAQETLKEWEQNENAVKAEEFSISRFDAAMHEDALPQEVVRAILAMPLKKIPAFTQVLVPEWGVVLLQLKGAGADEALNYELLQQDFKKNLNSLYTQRDLSLWLLSLRDQYEVKINEKALNLEN